MQIKSPLIITSRLCAGLNIGDATISIEYAKRSGAGARTRYQYYIDIGKRSYSGDNLQSGNCSDACLQFGLESLLAFLIACGEAYAYAIRSRLKHTSPFSIAQAWADSENGELFPLWIADWCYQNSDELNMLAIALEESPGAFIVE